MLFWHFLPSECLYFWPSSSHFTSIILKILFLHSPSLLVKVQVGKRIYSLTQQSHFWDSVPQMLYQNYEKTYAKVIKYVFSIFCYLGISGQQFSMGIEAENYKAPWSFSLEVTGHQFCSILLITQVTRPAQTQGVEK